MGPLEPSIPNHPKQNTTNHHPKPKNPTNHQMPPTLAQIQTKHIPKRRLQSLRNNPDQRTKLHNNHHPTPRNNHRTRNRQHNRILHIRLPTKQNQMTDYADLPDQDKLAPTYDQAYKEGYASYKPEQPIANPYNKPLTLLALHAYAAYMGWAGGWEAARRIWIRSLPKPNDRLPRTPRPRPNTPNQTTKHIKKDTTATTKTNHMKATNTNQNQTKAQANMTNQIMTTTSKHNLTNLEHIPWLVIMTLLWMTGCSKQSYECAVVTAEVNRAPNELNEQFDQMTIQLDREIKNSKGWIIFEDDQRKVQWPFGHWHDMNGKTPPKTNRLRIGFLHGQKLRLPARITVYY